MTKKVLTFGETMLRISPLSKEERVIQTDNFKIEPGGSESNVAINLSNLGNKSAFLTKLPDNVLGKKILRYLNKYDVNTNNIILNGEKLGTYWTEHGIGPRSSFVIYDRKNSAINTITKDELDYNNIFEGIDWFHSSGITPALSFNCMEILDSLIQKASDLSVSISLDLNYRSKLWRWIEETDYKIESVMDKLAMNCDLLVGNESDFQNMFGIKSEKDNEFNRYSEIANKVFSKFSNLSYMAVSLRDSISASENIWSGLLFVRENDSIKSYKSQSYQLKNIVDRVGGGDSFASGIIHGIMNELAYQEILDFSVAFSALKHTIRGDIAEFDIDNVQHLMDTDASGRIVR